MLTTDQNNRAEKLENIVFLVLFIAWFTLDFLFNIDIDSFSWSTEANYLHLLSPIKYCMMIYIFLFRRYSVRNWIIIFGVGILLFVSARRSEYYVILYAWLFIVAAKPEMIDRVIRVTFFLSLLYVILTVISALTGVLPNTFNRRGTEIRMALGFTHPNQLAFRILILAGCYTWLRRSSWRWMDDLVLFLVILILRFIANSLTSTLCAGLLLMAMLFRFIYTKLDGRWRSGVLWIIVMGTFCLNALFFILTFCYSDSGFTKTVSDIMSRRLEFGHQAFKDFGVSFLGQVVYLTKGEREFAGLAEELIVDNAYIHLLLREGILVFLIVNAGYFLCQVKAVKRNDYYTTVLLAIMAFYGSGETMLFWAMGNVFLIFLTDLFRHTDRDATIWEHGSKLLKRAV